jgi:hypothetical protein
LVRPGSTDRWMWDADRWIGAPPDVVAVPAEGSIRPGSPGRILES